MMTDANKENGHAGDKSFLSSIKEAFIMSMYGKEQAIAQPEPTLSIF